MRALKPRPAFDVSVQGLLSWFSRWIGRLRGPRATAASKPAAPLPAGRHDHLTRKERIRRYGHRHVTLAGDVVQSGPERRIADFLHRKGVRYVYEMPLSGATPDFYLPDHNIIIEHWGMDHTKYREKRMMKTRLYRKRGYTLVETEKKDVPHLERVLEARLRKVEPRVFDRR